MSLTRRGDNTYSNYAEANRAFWRQTVLPLVTRTANALARWLGPAWGSEITLRADLDQIEALSPEREALWARLEKASFLTDDEKRAAVGYAGEGESSSDLAAKAGFRVDQPRHPAGSSEGGQWAGVGDAQVHLAQGRGRPPRGPTPPPRTTPPTRPVPVPPGKTIRNQALAGQKHPKTRIPFDDQGFPDFSGVARKTVQVEHTGISRTDFAAANA